MGGWTAVRFENTEVITSGPRAMAMGNYYFTNQDGVAKVEYTFGYFLDSNKTLRINAHHSALPYPSQVTEAMVTAAQKAWGDGIIAISKSFTAMAMGNYYFTNQDGETKVEYSFGYFLDSDGNL